MLFKETDAVYCENHTDTKIHRVHRMKSLCMLKQVVNTVTTFSLKIKAILVIGRGGHRVLRC
jgi:hypothetical protein